MSALPPFLTDEEIFAIVHPLQQPAAIVRWFKNNGFPDIKVRPNGLPLITRTSFEAVYGAAKAVPAAPESVGEQPDVAGYLASLSSRAKSKAVSK